MADFTEDGVAVDSCDSAVEIAVFSSTALPAVVLVARVGLLVRAW